MCQSQKTKKESFNSGTTETGSNYILCDKQVASLRSVALSSMAGLYGASMRQSCIYNEHQWTLRYPSGTVTATCVASIAQASPKCKIISKHTEDQNSTRTVLTTATDTNGHKKELPIRPLHPLLTESSNNYHMASHFHIFIALHHMSLRYYALFMFSQRKPQKPVTHSWANPQIPNGQASQHGPWNQFREAQDVKIM